MVWLGGHGIKYSLEGIQGIWYDLAGIVYIMAWCAWHGIWYGLAGMVWYMFVGVEVLRACQ